jgi:uncharacterized protein (TIGR00255 family)
MISSMTGFGRSSGKGGEAISLSVSTRSVNHRYLELSIRLPDFLWELEPAIRSAAAEFFSRGKVDVTLRAQRTSENASQVRINRSMAEQVMPQLAALAEELGGQRTFTASDLLRLPDFLQIESGESEIDDQERSGILQVVREAFAQVRTMRREEGAALAADIGRRLDQIGSLQQEIEQARPLVQSETLEAYRERVAELSRQSGAVVDPDRLAQETVLMVEKSDVAEELTRMSSHLAQMRQLLSGGDAAGKKLDFLSQELLREINTLGTKSRSAQLRSVVVELKAELERIREQVQNVE